MANVTDWLNKPDTLGFKVNKFVNDYPHADNVMITSQIMHLVDIEMAKTRLDEFDTMMENAFKYKDYPIDRRNVLQTNLTNLEENKV